MAGPSELVSDLVEVAGKAGWAGESRTPDPVPRVSAILPSGVWGLECGKKRCISPTCSGVLVDLLAPLAFLFLADSISLFQALFCAWNAGVKPGRSSSNTRLYTAMSKLCPLDSSIFSISPPIYIFPCILQDLRRPTRTFLVQLPSCDRDSPRFFCFGGFPMSFLIWGGMAAGLIQDLC